VIARRTLAKKASAAAVEDPSKRKKAQPKAPRNKTKHDKKESNVKSQYQKDLDNIIAALDAPIRYEPPITVEEQERRRQIVRNFCIGNFQRHNEMEHDLSCKMKVKLHAIRMLPQQSKLKKAALDTDVGDEPPNWKGFPVWTPPIPGYNPMDYEEYMQDDED